MTDRLTIEQTDPPPEWTVRCHPQPGGYIATAHRQGGWHIEALSGTEARAMALIGGMTALVDLDTQVRVAS